MLQEFIDQKHVTLNGIVGIYPANAVGDDIEVYADESRETPTQTFYGLRQQSEKDDKADPYALPSHCPPLQNHAVVALYCSEQAAACVVDGAFWFLSRFVLRSCFYVMAVRLQR